VGTTFQKYEGLGNDFVVVDATDEQAISPARAVELCDRRRGVGADGVLLVLPPRASGDGAVARMRVINADGSVPEMCGNGVRCVALHLVRAGRVGPDGTAGPAAVAVETDAGLRVCAIDAVEAGRGGALITVDMGVVRVLGDRALRDLGEPSSDMTCTLADAGNPHAVLFGTFARGDVDRLGPRLATHPFFANGTNVEFAHVAGPAAEGGIDLVVWERGVGVTLACGTGACATVAVACARGLAPRDRPIGVRLPGGRLDIAVDGGGRATMRGPARFVFAGSVD
jgi:diaminopimelate epimerase